MLSIGIDAGSLTTKAVLMEESKVLSRALVHSSTRNAAVAAIDECLAKAGLKAGDVLAIVATGIGRNEVAQATGHATEIICDARGAVQALPDARTVMDLGAESSRLIRCDSSGRVTDFVLNDKCAAGTGVFMDAMSKALRVPMPDMGELSLKSTQDVNITSMCVVFAESEVVSQIHRKVAKEDILSGIHKSIATRLYGMLNRVGNEKQVVAVGGLARNIGVIKWIRELAGTEVLVPEYPEYAGAVGAALIAADRNKS